jgi:hypothetical protein
MLSSVITASNRWGFSRNAGSALALAVKPTVKYPKSVNVSVASLTKAASSSTMRTRPRPA